MGAIAVGYLAVMLLFGVVFLVAQGHLATVKNTTKRILHYRNR